MNNIESIKIYSFYYKNTEVLIDDKTYSPIMAGNACLDEKTNITGDDTGESISSKNFSYSELTGIYWVWKNTVQDVAGSCHYRRYFTCRKEPLDHSLKRILYFAAGLYKKRYGLLYTNNISRFKRQIINREEIIHILENYDAILPQPRKLKYSIRKHYDRYHNLSGNDLKIIESILQTSYPEYIDSFRKVLDSKRLYANNMFILRKEQFNEFMNWWFSVLFEFEKQIDLASYQGYQKRVIGFMAERLLSVWFHYKKLKIKELPVLYFKKLKY